MVLVLGLTFVLIHFGMLAVVLVLGLTFVSIHFGMLAVVLILGLTFVSIHFGMLAVVLILGLTFVSIHFGMLAVVLVLGLTFKVQSERRDVDEIDAFDLGNLPGLVLRALLLNGGLQHLLVYHRRLHRVVQATHAGDVDTSVYSTANTSEKTALNLVYFLTKCHKVPSRKEGNVLFNYTPNTFKKNYMVSDIRTIQIAREETRCHHTGYSFRLAARVLLYASSHRFLALPVSDHGFPFCSSPSFPELKCWFFRLPMWST